MTTDTKPTLAERLTAMGARVEMLRDSDGWRTLLKIQARMHQYSPNNLLLIAGQFPTATQVMGYRAWQNVDRQVKKGERGIRILAPRMARTDAGLVELAGFLSVAVFDISQTSGEELPDTWPPARAIKAIDLTNLIEVVSTLANVTITRSDCIGGTARGYLLPEEMRIHLYETDSPTMAATLLHELGHLYDPELDPATYNQAGNRADAELVAESVMAIAAETLHLEVSDSTDTYLASWLKDNDAPDTLLNLLPRISTSLRSVLSVITEVTHHCQDCPST